MRRQTLLCPTTSQLILHQHLLLFCVHLFFSCIRLQKLVMLEKQAGPETRAGSPRQKKVDFDLSATRMQDFYEYRRLVKRGKYPKPFDAAKKPSQSVLKHSNPSPINPFFKRAYNINYWTPEVTTTQLIEQMDSVETDT